MQNFSDTKYISAYKLNDNTVRLVSASGNMFDMPIPNKVISVSGGHPYSVVVCETQVGQRSYTIDMNNRSYRAN